MMVGMYRLDRRQTLGDHDDRVGQAVATMNAARERPLQTRSLG